MKKLWKMKKDAVSPVIATILMVAITVVLAAVLYVMVMGFGSNNQQQTPVITMTYQKADGLAGSDYTFTVASVNRNDVKISDINAVMAGETPVYAAIGTNTNVQAGDIVTIAGLTPGTPYTLTLVYAPTGGAAYQVSFTAT
jgi:archaeal type IV pilus assembly protein PilA